MKIYMVSLFHRATIKEDEVTVVVKYWCYNADYGEK